MAGDALWKIANSGIFASFVRGLIQWWHNGGTMVACNANATPVGRREWLTAPTSLVCIAEGFPYPIVPEATQPLKSKGPLSIKKWEEELKMHPDKTYVQTILQIIEVGAKICYQGPKTQILSKNFTSENEDSATLTKDLEKQMQHDRVTKLDAPWKNFISSPLGLAPNPNGGWRRIYHLSHPKKSINCNIPKEWRGIGIFKHWWCNRNAFGGSPRGNFGDKRPFRGIPPHSSYSRRLMVAGFRMRKCILNRSIFALRPSNFTVHFWPFCKRPALDALE